MEKVDFNSDKFQREIKQKQNQSGGKFTKKVDMTGLNMDKAKGLLKNNMIQIAIFLLAFLSVSGLIASVICIFTYPLYYLGWVFIGIGIFALLKKKISKIKL